MQTHRVRPRGAKLGDVTIAMKCTTHNIDANAVCPHCGKALCPSCSRSASGQRIACSDACAAALGKADKATELVIRKSVQMARVSAIGCKLSGALFVLFGVCDWFTFRGRPLTLSLFIASFGIALIICGFLYSKAAKQQAN